MLHGNFINIKNRRKNVFFLFKLREPKTHEKTKLLCDTQQQQRQNFVN